jgi:hypothetical protein
LDDFDDPSQLADWIREQRANVLEYLAGEGVAASVPPEPSWQEAPYVAIWAAMSSTAPGRVGWWVICGDVPTDYVSSSEIPDPRSAVRVFGRRWLKASKRMARGETSDDFSLGTPSEWPQLAPMLASRATLLADWANDDELWS